MADLRKRFGRLVAAHRKQRGMTQDTLAQKAELSVDMISRIEGGQTGASFPTIERLAAALGLDPAEMFTTEVVGSFGRSAAKQELFARLGAMNDREIGWIDQLLDAALKPRA